MTRYEVRGVTVTGEAVTGRAVTGEAVTGEAGTGRPDDLLTVRDLRKEYGRRKALSGCDLRLGPGVILGLLGPNGSGKSTLLKIIAGVVHASGGEVRIAGMRPGRATKGLVAYLPEGDCFYPGQTVRSLLAWVSGFYDDWDSARAAELVNFMGLDPGLSVEALSRGMRARLKMVLALARNARLALLDEPLAGIDPPSRSRIVRAIVREYRGQGQSIVVASHEVRHLEGALDEVAFLEAGRVKLTGAVEDLRGKHGRSLEELFEEVYV